MTATVYLDTWRNGVKRYDAPLDTACPHPHDGDWNGSPSTDGQLWQREAERAEQLRAEPCPACNDSGIVSDMHYNGSETMYPCPDCKA